MVYLVNSGDDELLLVARRTSDSVFDCDLFGKSLLVDISRFEVFKMNWSMQTWDSVANLGGRLLFVGEKSSVLLSGSDVRGCFRNPRYLTTYYDYRRCLQNCIYFADDHFCYDGESVNRHFDSDRAI